MSFKTGASRHFYLWGPAGYAHAGPENQAFENQQISFKVSRPI